MEIQILLSQSQDVNVHVNPLKPTVAIRVCTIMHPVPDRVKPGL